MAILLAIDSWLPHLQGKRAALIQTDATAALFNVERMAGRTPAMNSITAEIVLRLEAADVMSTPEHVPGVLNFTCDALSRLSQGAKIPPQLAHLPRVWPRPRLPSFFWTWPKNLKYVQLQDVALPKGNGQGALEVGHPSPN